MRKSLGRGIDAIISKVNIVPDGISKIPVDSIIPNRHQPRQSFDEESIKELAQSIKENGLAQPIVVMRVNENVYELIAGERRLRAYKYLGFKEIEAIVRENLSDSKKLLTALIENIQREDLNPIEKAFAYKKMIEMGMNQNDIANYCGKSKSSISNTLRLLDLDPEIIEAVKNNVITEGHARALIQIPDLDERKKVYHKILSDKLSVREVENYSKKYYKSNTKRKVYAHKTPHIIEMEKYLESKLGTKIEIKASDENSGKIIIYYFSIDDFERIKNKVA